MNKTKKTTKTVPAYRVEGSDGGTPRYWGKAVISKARAEELLKVALANSPQLKWEIKPTTFTY